MNDALNNPALAVAPAILGLAVAWLRSTSRLTVITGAVSAASAVCIVAAALIVRSLLTTKAEYPASPPAALEPPALTASGITPREAPPTGTAGEASHGEPAQGEPA